ncbi:amino acid ABC transporter permease [Mycolicibacterium cosmeticum]|uniref:Polar amino acid ABC transporter inner membrane protein n=1 Tax=Mycolicibacterium cosmeticum TaxID=258533 RepID=W9B846_MYCCO|nr:amino acid ABC transporter permease [Mycolicibacterium cosmeticum]TLH74149.1 amino acid ABC transporter permease [Mycolicibacterium cosmeticum]CDO11102.1 polar amino acid ABC transporter inner membrane protein [Mycolicibacterium cosmeticum]
MDFEWDMFTAALTSSAFLRGALLSVALAVCAMVLASIVGFGVALLRIASNRFATALGGAYVWFFRAIPTLLVLLLIWNAGPQLLPALRDDWFTPFLAALIGFSIVEAAYMAEILRSALLSVDEGQHLAARALGLAPHKVLFKVVLPQAIKVAIPPSGNELIAMLKYTSLASVISLRELLTTAQSQVSVTFRYAEYYSAALVYYLVIVSALMAVQHIVERRYRWISAGRIGQVPGNQVGAAVPA